MIFESLEMAGWLFSRPSLIKDGVPSYNRDIIRLHEPARLRLWLLPQRCSSRRPCRGTVLDEDCVHVLPPLARNSTILVVATLIYMLLWVYQLNAKYSLRTTESILIRSYLSLLAKPMLSKAVLRESCGIY